MATLRNKQKLAAMARVTQDCPRNNQSQNSSAPGITEESIAQVSDEIEGRVCKKLSQDFSRTESHILGALSKLDEFLLNKQIRTFAGTVPGTFRNPDVENLELSGDRSQNDPHPEVEFSACRASNLTDSDPDETSHSIKIYRCRFSRSSFCFTHQTETIVSVTSIVQPRGTDKVFHNSKGRTSSRPQMNRFCQSFTPRIRMNEELINFFWNHFCSTTENLQKLTVKMLETPMLKFLLCNVVFITHVRFAEDRDTNYSSGLEVLFLKDNIVCLKCSYENHECMKV